DLRTGRAALGDWASGVRLCPVAHGLPEGQAVNVLRVLSQSVELKRACDLAARRLGADPDGVRQFVELWDEQAFDAPWLLGELEAIWRERLADADAVQDLLTEAPSAHPQLLPAC